MKISGKRPKKKVKEMAKVATRLGKKTKRR